MLWPCMQRCSWLESRIPVGWRIRPRLQVLYLSLSINLSLSLSLSLSLQSKYDVLESAHCNYDAMYIHI